MIYAVFEMPDETENGLYQFETWDAFHAATFSPYRNTTVFSVPAFIPGRNYRERKHAAENALHRLRRIMDAPGLAWGDLAQLQAEAERVARRYGLLHEAREMLLI